MFQHVDDDGNLLIDVRETRTHPRGDQGRPVAGNIRPATDALPYLSLP